MNCVVKKRCAKLATGIFASSIRKRWRTSRAAIFGEHSGHVRMVVTYWDMAAALVNRGAISLELFNEANGEHIGVFAKIEPLLAEIRGAFGPQYATNLEKLIDATPDGRKRAKRHARADESDARSNGRQNTQAAQQRPSAPACGSLQGPHALHSLQERRSAHPIRRATAFSGIFSCGCSTWGSSDRCCLGIADSSFLFLPFGNDLLVVILTARDHAHLPLYVLTASIGSTLGVLLLDAVCRKGGEEGLKKMMKPQASGILQTAHGEPGRRRHRAGLPCPAALSVHLGYRQRQRIRLSPPAAAGSGFYRALGPIHALSACWPSASAARS